MLKTLRILLIILGTILIAANVLALVTRFNHFITMISEMEETAEKIGAIIGMFLLGIVGMILLLVARRVGKKLERKKAQKEVERFLS